LAKTIHKNKLAFSVVRAMLVFFFPSYLLECVLASPPCPYIQQVNYYDKVFLFYIPVSPQLKQVQGDFAATWPAFQKCLFSPFLGPENTVIKDREVKTLWIRK
jgi:hypothetical protein